MCTFIRDLVSQLKHRTRLSCGKLWRVRSWFISQDVQANSRAYLRDHQESMFFVTGSGRSGTQLITEVLASLPSVRVFHEPSFYEDVANMQTHRVNPAEARDYWIKFRSSVVHAKWLESSGCQVYGEVNGTIRYQIPAIKSLYPQARLFLMARDGRGVVRSMMGWPQFYGPGSKGAYALAPLPGDPFHEAWLGMSRFERVCWVWQETNEFLMKYIPESSWLQLEQLSADYDYFSTRFAGQLGLEITRDVWLSKTQQRSRNATKEYEFPHWNDWTDDQKAIFRRICGATMRKLGYEF